MTNDQTTNREFFVKRVGLRWLPVFVADDGIERPLWDERFVFWRFFRAMAVVSIAQQQWNDGLWISGNHPLQTVSKTE